MWDSGATPGATLGRPTNDTMPDEPGESNDEAMREMHERLRRGVALRELTEDERKARAQVLTEDKVTKGRAGIPRPFRNRDRDRRPDASAGPRRRRRHDPRLRTPA
jgi:hypothetical protein